jgi:hypothetical protein
MASCIVVPVFAYHMWSTTRDAVACVKLVLLPTPVHIGPGHRFRQLSPALTESRGQCSKLTQNEFHGPLERAYLSVLNDGGVAQRQ